MFKNSINNYKSNILFELKLYIKSIKLNWNKSGQINLEFYTNKNKLLDDATFFINSNENYIKPTTYIIIPLIVEYDKRTNLFKPIYLNIKMNLLSSNYYKEACNYKFNLSKVLNDKFNFSKLKINFKNLKDKNNYFEFLLDYNFIGTKINNTLVYFDDLSNKIQTYLIDNDIQSKRTIVELKNQLNVPDFLFKTIDLEYTYNNSSDKSFNSKNTDTSSIKSYKTNTNKFHLNLNIPSNNKDFEKTSEKFIKKKSKNTSKNVKKLKSLNLEDEEKAVTILKNKKITANLKIKELYNFSLINTNSINNSINNEITQQIENLKLKNKEILLKNQNLETNYKRSNLEILSLNRRINELCVQISEIKNEKNNIYDKLFELGYDDIFDFLNSNKYIDIFNESSIH